MAASMTLPRPCFFCPKDCEPVKFGVRNLNIPSLIFLEPLLTEVGHTFESVKKHNGQNCNFTLIQLVV